MAKEALTREDERFLERALEEAEIASEAGEVPIGAVVVCGGSIIGTGHNMTESLCDPTAHAEMIAMTSACNAIGGKYLSDCTLYVTVEPCPMCAAAMNWAQLGRLVYAAPDPRRGYSLFSPSLLHQRTKVVAACSASAGDGTAGTGLCEDIAEKASTLVKAFFQKQR